MSKLLFDHPPLVVLRPLAVLLGVTRALILQQIHFLTAENTPDADGLCWTDSHTYEWWAEHFEFLNARQVQRYFTGLEDDGLLLSQRDFKDFFDKGPKRYAINRAEIDALFARYTNNGMSVDRARYTKSGMSGISEEIKELTKNARHTKNGMSIRKKNPDSNNKRIIVADKPRPTPKKKVKGNKNGGRSLPLLIASLNKFFKLPPGALTSAMRAEAAKVAAWLGDLHADYSDEDLALFVDGFPEWFYEVHPQGEWRKTKQIKIRPATLYKEWPDYSVTLGLELPTLPTTENERNGNQPEQH